LESIFGNNSKAIELPTTLAGGSVSFKRHLGKPLSQELWEDLIHRFCINGLCIYRPNNLQWTIGWQDGHCIIELDEKDNVDDISISPYCISIYEKIKTK
jgi:hypothetical protein